MSENDSPKILFALMTRILLYLKQKRVCKKKQIKMAYSFLKNKATNDCDCLWENKLEKNTEERPGPGPEGELEFGQSSGQGQ